MRRMRLAGGFGMTGGQRGPAKWKMVNSRPTTEPSRGRDGTVSCRTRTNIGALFNRVTALVGPGWWERAQAEAAAAKNSEHGAEGVTLADFYAYMPLHNYIFAPSREPWPASSVNARISPVVIGTDEKGETIRSRPASGSTRTSRSR